MKTEDLQKKVEAAELKVEKCRKTIERHIVQMEKKGKLLRDMGIDPDSADKYAYAKQNDQDAYWLLCDYEQKKDDIDGATKKLAEAERICSGWKEKLDLEINKNKVIQAQVPDVIKEFLQEWKENAFQWYVQRYDAFLEYKGKVRGDARAAKVEALKTLPEYAELRQKWGGRLFEDDFFLNNPNPRKPMEKFLKERELDYDSINKKLARFADATVLKMCEFRDKQERLTWLDGALEEEKKNKMLDLVARVTKITGPITDAENLRIRAGDLNGTILGEKGAAKIQTISAGGYNIQCFHYRVLIDDVTQKVMPSPDKKKPSLDILIKSASTKQGGSARDEGKNHSDIER